MPAPVSFTQTHGDGWTSGPHAWEPRSSNIIRRNLSRTDAGAIQRVVVTHQDGSRATYRRREG